MKTSTMLTSTKEVRTENTYESTTGYQASFKHNTTNARGNVVYNFDYDALEPAEECTGDGSQWHKDNLKTRAL